MEKLKNEGAIPWNNWKSRKCPINTEANRAEKRN